MCRWLILAVLALAAAAPEAGAIPVNGTVIVDRPSGTGALPFDGIAGSSTSAHSLTPDGRYVVFSSSSNALLSGDEDSASNIYRLDTTTGALVQVDVNATGAQPTPGSRNERASISADGNFVGFITTSPTLDAAASREKPQFVVKNLTTGAVELASRSNGAAGAAVEGLQSAVLSGDGRHVAFSAESAVQADNATGLTTTVDAYLRSLDTNTTHMVSVTSGGAEGGDVREPPDIDYAGDAVSFVTDKALVPGDTDTGFDAYVHMMDAPERTLLASFSGGGQTEFADSGFGATVAGGAGGTVDVGWSSGNADWVAPCAATCTTAAARADHARTGGTDNGENQPPFFPAAASGALPSRVYFVAQEALDPADTNKAPDLYGWDIGGTNFDTSIHLMTSGVALDGEFGTATSETGAVVTYVSESPELPGTEGLIPAAFIRSAGVDTDLSEPPGQVLVDSAGDGFTNRLHASSDSGEVVAFESDATIFGSPVGAPFGPPYQALIRNVVSGTTTLISATPEGAAGNASSQPPSVDAAGDIAVFESEASNLLPGDTSGTRDVFARNLATGATTLVDRTPGGGFPARGASSPQISADGTKVVYVSSSPDIEGSPADGHQHVYEVDLATGNVTLMDRTSAGAVANGNAFEPDIDGNGARVAFLSEATNLGGSNRSIYVRDISNPARPVTTWVSVPQSGAPADDNAGEPTIDREGTRVAYSERSPTFGFGVTGFAQVFVTDLAAHTTTLASTGPAGPGTPESSGPSLSADGTRVAFSSDSTSLPGAVAGYDDVYVRDLNAGTTVLASAVDGSGSAGRFGADGGSLSGNGACVVFGSDSDNLVAGGYGADFEHVFLHALTGACPAPPVPPVPPAAKTPPVISHLHLTHRRFAVGSKRTAVSAAKKKPKHKSKPKPPHGTAFEFTLNEAAGVRIAITQKLPGHRKSRKAKCKAAHKGQKHNCTRTLTRVTLIRAKARAGSNTVSFSGRYAKTKLAKGTYTATIVATNAAGERSAARSVSFTVVR
ncbi:MAG TPA: hypothetical protein VGG08_03745 [Solirubrobacteraceae bacterium]|jgi:Tol biopolymer transport system component